MSFDPSTEARENDPVTRYRVIAPNLVDLRAYLRSTGVDYGCRPYVTRTDDGEVITTVIVPANSRDRSRSLHPSVQLVELEEPMTTRPARSAEVGEGNRFASSESIPRGVGRKG